MSSEGATTITGALASALKDIATIVIDDAHNFPEFAASVLRSCILPAVEILLILLILSKLCSKAYRYFYPPSAKELYREALTIYNQQANVKRTEQLLWEAIQQSPEWKPALLSLIALYVYRLEQPHQALKILDGYDVCRHDPEFQPLRTDAKAMLESNHHMVHKLLGEDAYLSLRTAAVSKFQ